MNILVTGANGQLGRSIKKISTESHNNYTFTDIDQLDICDLNVLKSFVAKNGQFDVIVNCAAFTNVERAETDTDVAEKINADAVRNLAIIARENDAVLIHISTDYVFDGKQNLPLTENDTTNPQSVYGYTKLLGEKYLSESKCKHIIIRTAWLYSEFGRNFVKTILKLSNEKPKLNVVFDQIGSPTYAGDLAHAIVDIIENNKYHNKDGIYHFSNQGICSWYDLAHNIATLSSNTTCKIEPCHTSEFPTKATRPAYSVLDTTKFKETFGIVIPYWIDSLNKCIQILISQQDDQL